MTRLWVFFEARRCCRAHLLLSSAHSSYSLVVALVAIKVAIVVIFVALVILIVLAILRDRSRRKREADNF